MKRMKLSELTGNEILAQSLMTWDYQIILPEGVVLKKEYISKIEEMGILEVYVKEDQANEIVILKNDIEKTIKNKVKSILERHTYHNNKELQGLTQAADEIITNILDEKEVIEKVFDIRERSADIYEHSISLSSMAILTALRLKLDKSVIHDIGVGCLLHDIGLRYTTLDYEDKSMEDMKPEALAEYKKHPVYGYTSVKDEDWISDEVKKIILYHHERLDGSGFPLKLKEAEIPFSWLVKDDHFVDVGDIYESQKIMNEALNEWILSLNEEQVRTFVDTLYQVISASQADDLITFTADWKKSMNAVVTALKEVDDQTAEMLRGIIRSLFEIAKVKVREELVPVKRPRHRFKNKKKEEKGEVPRHTPAASPDATVTQGSAARHAPKLRGSHRQGRPG